MPIGFFLIAGLLFGHSNIAQQPIQKVKNSHSIFTLSRFKHYSLNYDSTTNNYFLRDSLTSVDKYIHLRFARNPRFYENNFVLISQGDMKALMSLDGRVLIEEAHIIRKTGNCIGAYLCKGRWIIVSNAGDSINGGNCNNNYLPDLSYKLNPAYILLKPDSTNNWSAPRWGYLDSSGRWAIAPQFDHAELFINDTAEVSLQNNLYVIDRNGRIIHTLKK